MNDRGKRRRKQERKEAESSKAHDSKGETNRSEKPWCIQGTTFCLKWLDMHDSVKFSKSILQSTVVPVISGKYVPRPPRSMPETTDSTKPIYTMFFPVHIYL